MFYSPSSSAKVNFLRGTSKLKLDPESMITAPRRMHFFSRKLAHPALIPQSRIVLLVRSKMFESPIHLHRGESPTASHRPQRPSTRHESNGMGTTEIREVGVSTYILILHPGWVGLHRLQPRKRPHGPSVPTRPGCHTRQDEWLRVRLLATIAAAATAAVIQGLRGLGSLLG